MLYLTIIGGGFVAWLILVLLFTPHIGYHAEAPVDPRSDHFIRVIESVCLARFHRGNQVELFANGPSFYPAMLAAIRDARETVNLECYIFARSDIGEQFVEALADRSREGVRVTIVLDSIGSFGSFRGVAARLLDAGCRIERYQRMRWYSLARFNNRTHRELLVVDGRVAFVGGAGVADWWWKPHRGKPMWRDMMARVEGPVVSDIQGIVAENWLECTGEILTGSDTYKHNEPVGASSVLAVKSSPSDRATSSRVLFQLLVESAETCVRISTPYFLPDKAFRRAIARTAARHVAIEVVVPGQRTDQRWVRLASRRMYGELLRCGIRIFEYGESMTHLKMLVVDDLWSVLGTTNLDNRSFEHNDEVNVAIRDEAVASRLNCDFSADCAKSREIVLAEWERRPLWEKLIGRVAWVLERQQ